MGQCSALKKLLNAQRYVAKIRPVYVEDDPESALFLINLCIRQLRKELKDDDEVRP